MCHTAQRGQQGGNDGHGDDAVRQHEDQVGLLVGRQTGRGEAGVGCVDVGEGCQAGDHDVARLVDRHQAQGPQRQMAGPAQARSLPVPPRAPAVSRAHQDRDQDEGLQGDAQGGADAEDRDLVGGQDAISGRGCARDRKEQQEGRNGDDVVEDGREHRCAELAAGVEHLTEQRVDAVEEDLREAEPGKRRGQLPLGFAVGGRGVEVDQQGCEQDGCDGEHQEHGPGEGDEAVGVRRATVRVLLHAADELRDEDRVQCAAHDEYVEDVGHRVAQRIGVRDEEESQRRREGDVTKDPGDARDDRARRHDTARPDEPASGGARFLLVDGVEVVDARHRVQGDLRLRQGIAVAHVASGSAGVADREARPRPRARRTMSKTTSRARMMAAPTTTHSAARE